MMKSPSERAQSEEPRNVDAPEGQPTPPPAVPSRKRPRLDLTTAPRKRGKTMFGILVGTLNKAKDEDTQRNNSEAARRRLDIETKLKSKLAQEQTEMRRQSEIKKHRSLASRKEDDLAIQDSVLRLMNKTKPYLSHFLTTSDNDSLPASESNPLSLPVSVAPPVAKQTVLYYLPAILLPEQEAFLKQRQDAILAQVEKEHRLWNQERRQVMEEVEGLRQQAEDLATTAGGLEEADNEMSQAVEEEVVPAFPEVPTESTATAKVEDEADAGEEALEY